MTGDLEALTDPVRDRAIKQLKKRYDFATHLLVYVLVNSFIVVIWATINSGGFFWLVFPIVGWASAWS